MKKDIHPDYHMIEVAGRMAPGVSMDDMGARLDDLSLAESAAIDALQPEDLDELLHRLQATVAASNRTARLTAGCWSSHRR